MGIDGRLGDARRKLRRLTPPEAHSALADGALLIDIRSEIQRATDGIVPGARIVSRNLLERRLDPSSSARDPELARPDALIIVMCDEGSQSSFAAAALQVLGLNATDLTGGFQAWRTTGLPVRLPAREDFSGALFRVHGH